MFGRRRSPEIKNLSSKNILRIVSRAANQAATVKGHAPDRDAVEDLRCLIEVALDRYDPVGPAAEGGEDKADAGTLSEDDIPADGHGHDEEDVIRLVIDKTPEGEALRGARNWLGLGLEVVVDTIGMSRTGYQNIEAGRSASTKTLGAHIVPFYSNEQITFYSNQEDPAIQVIGRNIPEGMEILLVNQPEPSELLD